MLFLYGFLCIVVECRKTTSKSMSLLYFRNQLLVLTFGVKHLNLDCQLEMNSLSKKLEMNSTAAATWSDTKV